MTRAIERRNTPQCPIPSAVHGVLWPVRALVADACRALACLNSARLEELALSCEALNRELGAAVPELRRSLARDAKEAVDEMAVFARVLEATRANIQVMEHLQDLRSGRLEYGDTPDRGWSGVEKGHGDH